MEDSSVLKLKVQVFYFELLKTGYERSIKIEFNGLNLCGICASNDLNNNKKEYFVIINENFIKNDFNKPITIKLNSFYNSNVEERNIIVSEDLFYDKQAIFVDINGFLKKKYINTDNTKETYFSGLSEIDLDKFLSNCCTLSQFSKNYTDFKDNFKKEFDAYVTNKNDMDLVYLNLSKSENIKILCITRFYKLVDRESNILMRGLHNFLSSFIDLIKIAENCVDKDEKDALFQICLHSTRVLNEEIFYDPIKNAYNIMEAFSINKIKCVFNHEFRNNLNNSNNFPYYDLDKKIDSIIKSNNFIENFTSVMNLLGLNPDQKIIEEYLFEKDYIIISNLNYIIIHGLSGFKNVILFIDQFEANNNYLADKTLNRLTATYFHEKCHNIVRKLIGNEYINSPRGDKLESKLEAGYLGEILFFGGLITDQEIKTDVNKLNSKEIDEKVSLLNGLNILNSGIKCCGAIRFMK